MHILQGGVPKCGNFWLYQIIQQILSRSGHNTTTFIQQQPIYNLAREWDLNYPSQAGIDVLEITDLQYSYRISSIFRMPVLNLAEYIMQTPHVWTHSPVCKKSDEVFNLFDKKVYIIRDPRDRAISAAKYYTSEYMLKYYPQPETDPDKFLQKNFENLMHEWVWHVYDHLRLSQTYNIHITFYEAFLADFQGELTRLLTYLGIELGPEQKAELAEAMHFSALKKQNPKHLKKGESYYWKNGLTKEQQEKAAIMAGPLLQYLNYPLEEISGLPAFTPVAASYFEELKEQIITSQLPLYQE
ncbi:sulfotransferase domain-containing protein [Adhaeribacter aquaticus]|uniref:sulfotransferase domain-containing protein n=1 Tax=Adhaeribacter aquaticus TaxID=299567 RepID=UPI00040BD01F|nr:sulfotransferase domain-containing protein [Adhaeribacter aquaticus]